jgi:group I intron endonuclease
MKFNYQDHSNKPGIYKITNLISNKIYVGSAAKFERRWYDHKKSLLNGRHQNKHLLNSFQVHGTDAFVFDVVEVMENSIKAERLIREEFHLQEIIKQGIQVYNSQLEPTKEAVVRTCYSNTPEETSKKLSEARTGRKHADETKKKIGEANKGENSGNFGKIPWNKGKQCIQLSGHGKPQSEETKEKNRQTHLGKHLSETHKANIGKSLIGKKYKPCSKEHKQKISEGLKIYHDSTNSYKTTEASQRAPAHSQVNVKGRTPSLGSYAQAIEA